MMIFKDHDHLIDGSKFEAYLNRSMEILDLLCSEKGKQKRYGRLHISL